MSLERHVRLPGAVMLGLGSIVGSGIFVSIGVAAGIAGPALLVAVAIGALVATFNGLSSAQLAASHPVAGGTYEYGYRYLSPALGFTAGWLFLIAKTASAATAALGFAGYLLTALGGPPEWRVPLAFAAAALVTALVLGGIRRSTLANTLIVGFTLLTLLVFALAGLPGAAAGLHVNLLAPLRQGTDLQSLLYASALMFVAYTGYGRVATLGEEVRDPLRTIPRAIVLTLLATMGIYLLVTTVAVGAVGAGALAEATGRRAAPLAVAAGGIGGPGLAALVSAGAVTAMLGVLLNLVLGLSRVLLAMGRRGDMPRVFGRVGALGGAAGGAGGRAPGGASGGAASTPGPAVLAVGAAIAALTLLGDVRLTWSFSAFAVLVYYAITNLAALALPAGRRLFPRWVAGLGLVSCLGLAFFVPLGVWAAGLVLVAVGLAARRALAEPWR